MTLPPSLPLPHSFFCPSLYLSLTLSPLSLIFLNDFSFVFLLFIAPLFVFCFCLLRFSWLGTGVCKLVTFLINIIVGGGGNFIKHLWCSSTVPAALQLPSLYGMGGNLLPPRSVLIFIASSARHTKLSN